MTKKLLTILLVGLMLDFTSCITYDNHGYPSKVTFSKKGGEKIVHGSACCGYIHIQDYNRTVWGYTDLTDTGEWPDTLCATCAWLTAKQIDGSNEIILIAEPNKTNKKRTLYIDLDFGPTQGEITVKQKK